MIPQNVELLSYIHLYKLQSYNSELAKRKEAPKPPQEEIPFEISRVLIVKDSRIQTNQLYFISYIYFISNQIVKYEKRNFHKFSISIETYWATLRNYFQFHKFAYIYKTHHIRKQIKNFHDDYIVVQFLMTP